MTLLSIVIAPDKRLKTPAKAVADITPRIRRLLDDMLETMYDAPGIGLAAPQIGVLERLIVMDLAEKDESPQPIRLINPEILWVSEERRLFNEGCLSLPETYADIERPAEVKIKYLDETGKEQRLHATDLLATCIQHEIDHINGILFTDHLSLVKRNMIMRKLQKIKKLDEK